MVLLNKTYSIRCGCPTTIVRAITLSSILTNALINDIDIFHQYHPVLWKIERSFRQFIMNLF